MGLSSWTWLKIEKETYFSFLLKLDLLGGFMRLCGIFLSSVSVINSSVQFSSHCLNEEEGEEEEEFNGCPVKKGSSYREGKELVL